MKGSPMTTQVALKAGDKAPAFSINDQNGNQINLSDFEGKWVVLYAYPKDNTPGCTTEAIDFTALQKEFEAQNSVVLGVSPDSEKSHCNFIQKKNITFTLLSDTDHKLLENYGTWGLKKNFGKEYYGVIRTTFLINPQGNIAHIWTKVKVKEHARAVLDKLKSLQN